MQNYVICNDSGEDKNCSNKFFPDYNPADHDFYFWDLGKILKCWKQNIFINSKLMILVSQSNDKCLNLFFYKVSKDI